MGTEYPAPLTALAAREPRAPAATRADILTRVHLHPMADKSQKRPGKLSRPADRRGVPDAGRIVKLFIGQGHGIIRVANGTEIFFHRSDMQEGASINDFSVGDVVEFERLDDAVSGARALAVKRRRSGGSESA